MMMLQKIVSYLSYKIILFFHYLCLFKKMSFSHFRNKIQNIGVTYRIWMKSLNVIFHCHNQQINLLMRSLKQNLIIIDKVLTNSLTICKCHDSESSYSIHRSQIKSKGKNWSHIKPNNVKLFLDLCTFVHANISNNIFSSFCHFSVVMIP